MNPVCIYCGCKDNLNTQFAIAVPVAGKEGETEKVVVLICDEHSEDATPKSAREKYVERQKKMDEVLAMARALGMDLSQTSQASGLTIVTSQKPQNRNQVTQAMGGRQAQPQPVAITEAEADPDFVSTEVADAKLSRLRGVSGMAGHQQVEAHSAHDTSTLREEIPSDLLKGRVKTERIERQNGSAMAIPTKKVDGLGTTTVTVVQTNDAEIQRRFKAKAEQSKSEYGWDQMKHLGRDGYDLVNCPLCRGVCTIKHLGKEIVCPKCGGRGQI